MFLIRIIRVLPGRAGDGGQALRSYNMDSADPDDPSERQSLRNEMDALPHNDEDEKGRVDTASLPLHTMDKLTDPSVGQKSSRKYEQYCIVRNASESQTIFHS